MNISQSYKQERGCLVHFVRLANTLLKYEESARDNHVLACNFATYSPILIFYGRLSNKPLFIWLLATPQHRKYVATLHCSISLIVCFLTLMFHKIVWQHMQGVMGLLISSFLQIYHRIFQ